MELTVRLVGVLSYGSSTNRGRPLFLAGRHAVSQAVNRHWTGMCSRSQRLGFWLA